MRVAIIGAGFTGLAAGLRAQQKGHHITIFEKELELGGLAAGFSNPQWDWTIDKVYHHWFINDEAVLNLAKELEHKVIIKRPSTDISINGKNFQLDNAISLLKFTPLSIVDRLRTGFVLLYLKSVNDHKKLEKREALPWIKTVMGNAADMIWEPLFEGKFGHYKNDVMLAWFWARIKKRTSKLAYPVGGFKAFTDRLADKIREEDGEILTGKTVERLQNWGKKVQIKTGEKVHYYDKVIVTLPSSIFTKITPSLPKAYARKLSSIPHLHALILILVLKKPFLKDTYWLNITDRRFPFLVLVEHTNFMDPKHYGNQHILYISNYITSDHPYLKMSSRKLLKIFDPFLKQINPAYQKSLITSYKIIEPFAQPVITTDYPKLRLDFKTPLKNTYLANMDMVYPWDRGTNYAVEMGENVARII